MAENKKSSLITSSKMLNVDFIKQIIDGEGVFNSLFNLVNYQSLLSNLVSLGPCLKLSFFYKMQKNLVNTCEFFRIIGFSDIISL